MNRPPNRFLNVAAQAVCILRRVQENQGLDGNSFATACPRFAGEKIKLEKALPVLPKNGIHGPASPDDLYQCFHRGLAMRLDDHIRKLVPCPIQQSR